MKTHLRNGERASLCGRFSHGDETTDVVASVDCVACAHVLATPMAREHARAIDRRLRFRGKKFR